MTDDMRLSRVTLADRLFEQLRQQILSGRLAVGDALPSEQEIGEAFGVGRTTVREALHGLVSSGLVDRSGRSLIVRHPDAIDTITLDFAAFSSRSSVTQVYEARKLLEVPAVRLAAANRTAENLKNMESFLERLRTEDPEIYHAADPQFHEAIVKASGNEILYQIFVSSRQVFFKLPAFWRIFGKSSEESSRPGGSPQRRIGSGYEGHRTIFEAIGGGDGETAGRLMTEHLDRVQQGLMAAIVAPSDTSPDSDMAADHQGGVDWVVPEPEARSSTQQER